MANKMLIDASHPEETRVVVTRGNRVEEFDFESASRKQLRGNIYLAKVTRVEPSLQAAFVDFGGNRHGFLAFSEIHPDYYQIPVADREALLADEAARARREDEDEESRSSRGGENGRDARRNRRGRGRPRSAQRGANTDAVVSGDTAEHQDDAEASDEIVALSPDEAESGPSEDGDGSDQASGAVESRSEEAPYAADDAKDASGNGSSDGDEADEEDGDEDEPQEEEVIEQMGGADALEEVPSRHYHARRQYKIQEVIKRRQILLIQVVKEERGNKGAALTTYLSLAGRYSVLMPNTARGGGISRKITSGIDRKRLKEVVGELDVPEGMGVILRTAGAARTKPEIKRDFEYLLRVWENVRELTLQSTAPALVYEEGSLIKRAIRDLYSKDIETIQVCGEHGYREAKEFMRMLMPSHSRMVQNYREPQPLFARFGVEQQLDAMFSNVVTLRSGGYLVINQTEALVAIDVNSGRSTREHNIEDTALKTNLEAAEEVARQLRLRDLAGLIVIDFIDMEENRNNRAVERKLKECLKDDRARIQIGRISHFGLMEMSRQRIRTGVLESSTVPCAHCGGTGFLRSTPSIALQLLRAVEDTMLRSPHYNIVVRTRTEVALYVLNHKRANLSLLEDQSGVSILIQADETVMGTTSYVVERGDYVEAAALRPARALTAPVVIDEEEELLDAEAMDEQEETGESSEDSREERGEDGGQRRRGRRRRRRGGRDRDSDGLPRESAGADDGEAEDDESGEAGENDEAEGETPRAYAVAEAEGDEAARKRRRRRRGGRRNRRDRDEPGFPRETAVGAADEAMLGEGDEPSMLDDGHENAYAVAPPEEADMASPAELAPREEPKPRRGRRAAKAAEAPAEAIRDVAATAEAALGSEDVKPKRSRRKVVPIVEPEVTAPAPIADDEVPAAAPAEPTPVAAAPARSRPQPEPEPEYTGPKRTGWWAKAKQVLGGE